MGRIQSNIGLISGFPIQETVDKLIAISAQPRDLLLSRNKQLQAEQTAIAELTAAVLAVQLAGNNLGKATIFDSKTATSSNAAALSATITGTPAAGSYQFTPLQKAQSQQLASHGFASLTSPIGAGEIVFQRGGFVDEGLSLDLLNGGAGVSRGKIRITDRSGSSAEVDLRFSLNVDDVLDAINNASGIEVTAVAEGDRLRLVDNTGQTTSNLRVQEVSGGSTAADLGLAAVNVAADEALGSDVLRLDASLQIARLSGGRGLSLRDGLADLQVSFRDGSADLLLDFSELADPEKRDTATLGELLDVINAADPTRLSAAISGDGDRIILTDLTADSGGTFSVSSALGGTLAEELALSSPAVADTLTGGRLLAGLNDTLLSGLAGGAGLGALGDLDLTDRSGAQATVDLSSAATLGDVIQAINAAGIGVKAAYNAARNGVIIEDTSGGSGNLVVANGDAANTAMKLQIAIDAAIGKVDSSSLHRQIVSRQTKLATYKAGQPVAAGKLTIRDTAGAAAIIDLSSVEGKTIGDVIDLVNAAGIGVRAEINAAGDGIRLVDTVHGTGTLKVSASRGTTAADLKLLGDATELDISGTPTQVIDGSTAYRVEISSTDTLSDLVTKINALGAGINAGIVSDGTGTTPHRLSLVSQVSGKAGELLIDGSGSSITLTEVVKAQDARLLFGSSASGGVLAASSTNSFTGLVSGLNLKVEGTSSEPVTITIAATNSSLVSAVESLVTQYNKLRDKIDQHTFFNSENNTAGILFGSNETLRLESDLSRLITGRFSTTAGVQSLEQLGVSVGEDGKLSLDKEKLQAAQAADPEGVKNFFTAETTGFSSKLSAMIETMAGEGTSLLITRSEALSRKVDSNASRADRLTERLERERELLTKRFIAMEAAIAKIQNSLSAIEQLQIIPPL